MEFELPDDFKELLELFNENGVEYLLIGGYAVALHGYVRSTNDIDFFVSGTEENAKRLVSALADFGFASSGLSIELFTRKDSLVIMGVEPLAVDILNYLTGLDFESAYRRRKVIISEGIEISLIDLDDLITNKVATGRLKDLADVDYLKEIISSC
jgi:Nucleotidyl transferase of unknown function (DUF2204)